MLIKNKILHKALSLLLSFAMICGLGSGILQIAVFEPLQAAAAPADGPIYRDYANYSFAERAADMVARMTLAQKTQNMISTSPATTAGNDASGTLSTGIKSYEWWQEALHGYSRGNTSNATSYPITFSMGQTWDPELNYRVATEIGNEIRELAPGLDSNLNFYSPTVNLSRDPRWGRNSESYGEDPVHSAIMAAQFLNGMKGFAMDGKTPIDPNGYWKTNPTLKHYFANNSETNRLDGVSNMTEQEAREYYSRVYREIVRRAMPASVMSAYNRIQIAHTAYSPFLELPGGIDHYTLDTMLRQTFGFTGYVTSDCDSANVASAGSGTANTSASQGSDGNYGSSGHGYRWPAYKWYGEAADTAPAAVTALSQAQMPAWAVMGGAELECSGGVASSTAYSTQRPLADKEYKNAVITPLCRYTESAVDVAVAELLEARLRLGEWDDKASYTGAPSSTSNNRVKWFDEAKSRLVAYGMTVPTGTSGASNTNALTMTTDRLALVGEAAAKSLVLLKNDINAGKTLLPVTFPVSGDFSVGVYGGARARVDLGLYSASRTTTGTAKQVNPVTGIRTALQDKFGSRITVRDGGATSTNAAATDEYVIAVVGDEGTGVASEQNDRANFALKAADITLIKSLYQQNKNLIVVILTASTIGEVTTSTSVDNMFESAPAVLYSCFLGDRPGSGIGDVIAGNVNPSARTNATWYPLSTPYGRPSVAADLINTDGSLNQIRSYRLSPGIDGPWQSPYGAEWRPVAGPYSFEGPNLGRTYMYYNGTGIKAIRYPFGYGLSYTTFDYSAPVIKVNGIAQAAGLLTVNPNDKIEYTFTVTNTGNVAGADVAQLYVKTPDDVFALSSTGSKEQAYAVKRLKDFKKTKELKPQESQELTLSVDVSDIAFWSNEGKKFELLQLTDNYSLQVSRSSADSFVVNGVEHGVRLSAPMRISGAANWNPKISVVSFKPNTPEDARNSIPQRILFNLGKTVLPNPTVCMTNDVLYGYINRMYSSADGNMYPIPENITFKYTSNRPNVVSVGTDGTITALNYGVATITGTATDSLTNSSATGEFVVYVVKDPLDGLDHDVTMKQFTYNGETIPVAYGTEVYNVHVPGDITNVAFTKNDVTVDYPEKVDVTVTLNPVNGAVSPGKPCVATVSIKSKTFPLEMTYTINFGQMTFTWQKGENYMGYNSFVNVTFSDGVTAYKLVQAFYDRDDKLVMVNVGELPPIPRHTDGLLNTSTASDIDPEDLNNWCLKEFLWDENYVPILSPQIKPPRSLTPPVGVWRPATTLVPGKAYMIVSPTAGRAMTNQSVSVPIGMGVSYGQTGLVGTVVPLSEDGWDYISLPENVSGTMLWTFTAASSTASAPYSSGYYIKASANGTGGGASNLNRQSSNSQPTCPIRTSAAGSSRDQDVWFTSPINPDTCELMVFVHSSSNNYTFGLIGNNTGFVGEGGEGGNESSPGVAPIVIPAAARVKLYEYIPG